MIGATDLCFRIGDRVILDRISFSIGRGESVGLVGPNGSGKTSILRCLLGLVPFTGRAVVDGYDVVREPIAARSRIGYVPQKAAFGDAPALEVLTFVAKLRRLEPRRIAAVLEQVGLTPHAQERVRTFSGGMQQRLSLAVALLVDAPVLLFDEPSASLDREGQKTFFDVVKQLRRRGRTMLLASHRAEEVSCLTDRVLEIDCGRISAAPALRTARVIPLAAAEGDGGEQPLDTAPERTGPTRDDRKKVFDLKPLTPSSRPLLAAYRGTPAGRKSTASGGERA